MPSRLIQSDKHASGEASFQVLGPAVKSIQSPEGVRIGILQPGQTELYLDPNNPDDPWTTAVSYFAPMQARLEGNTFWLDVDIGVIFHLHANKPYSLLIAQTGVADVHEVFTVPATLRRPAKLPQGWKAPAAPAGPIRAEAPDPVEPEPQQDPAPLPTQQPDTTIASTDSPKPDSAGKGWLVWAALLAVLLIGGAIAYFLWLKPQEPEPEPEPAPVIEAAEAKTEQTLQSVRRLLAGSPSAADARSMADELLAEGKLPDGQFLLYRYAAEQGDAQAARTMGEFYDPNTWEQGKSPMPAPNVEEAERWLRQAAEAGDVQAQYRYGMLLKQGRTDAPDGPEQGVVWLRKAADQGHEQAAKALNP